MRWVLCLSLFVMGFIIENSHQVTETSPKALIWEVLDKQTKIEKQLMALQDEPLPSLDASSNTESHLLMTALELESSSSPFSKEVELAKLVRERMKDNEDLLMTLSGKLGGPTL